MRCKTCEHFKSLKPADRKGCKQDTTEMEMECLLKHILWTLRYASEVQEAHAKKALDIMNKAEKDSEEGEDWKK